MLIEVKGLCKTYGKGESEVRALDNVSFDIQRGEMTAVVGASGAGKSTLLHLLGGLDTPSCGVVRYEGESIYGMSERRLTKFRLQRIGFVFQFFNLIPELTAWRNIMLPQSLKGKPDTHYLKSLCERLGIADRLSHYPSELSGGQQQRVAIARALANKPDVLLCDEPTGNLDQGSGKEVLGLLKELSQDGQQTVIIITHDKTAAGVCSRILTIRDGRLFENG